MGFILVGYKELKIGLVQCAQGLLRRRNKSTDPNEFITAYLTGTPDSKKLLSVYPKSVEIRQQQLGLMLTLIRLLDASPKPEDQKAQVLNAIAFYIRGQILTSYDPRQSWTNYVASFGTSVEKSKLYGALGTALNLNKFNHPTHKEMRDMLIALKDFIRATIYKTDKDPSQGYSAGVGYFLDRKIPGFNIESFLTDLNNKIQVLDNLLILAAPKKSAPVIVTPANTGLSMFTALEDLAFECAVGVEADDLSSRAAVVVV